MDSNQFSAESLIKKKKKIIDLNPYTCNNKTLHCLLRFKVGKITDFDELKIMKKLFRAG